MTIFPGDVTSFQDKAAEDEHACSADAKAHALCHAALLLGHPKDMSSMPNFKLYEIQIRSQKEGQDPKVMPLCHHLI